MVKELEADTSKADFDVELSKYPGKVVVVDFHATWCGPCKMIAPKLKAMEEEWKDKLVVLKVDVDDCAEIAEKMGISAMPTFFIFKDGNKVGDVVGANEAKLRETITALL
ncbi:thioredoxin-2-like [Haliotis rufescens]|uniref:thioredoxin-2-like n=1 Tax=Haliotis rufescens TaxID=6454 RepID=UPI001EB03B40|nr:thioredoxin-2-like [Haliotis rufescens]